MMHNTTYDRIEAIGRWIRMVAAADHGNLQLVPGVLCYVMPLPPTRNGNICSLQSALRIAYIYTPDYAAAIVGKIDTSPKKRL